MQTIENIVTHLRNELEQLLGSQLESGCMHVALDTEMLVKLQSSLETIQQKNKELECDLLRLNNELSETRARTLEAQRAGRFYGDYWRDLALMSQGCSIDPTEGKKIQLDMPMMQKEDQNNPNFRFTSPPRP